MTCANISSLVVLDRDGVEKTAAGAPSAAITGPVELLGGNAFSVAGDPDSKAITINMDGSGAPADPVYKAKWQQILNGTGGYGGPPYYIATLNRSAPAADGTFFLLGGLCPQVGLLQDKGLPTVYAADQKHRLEFFDMCQACVDCADYALLFKYVDRIAEWLDANKDDNLTDGLRLFKQYQATVHYWNYMVHTQSIPLKVYVQGSGIGVKTGYRCLDCGPYANVVVTIGIELLSGDAPDSVTWSLGGLNLEPSDLDVGVFVTPEESTAPSDSYENNQVIITITSIDKNEYAIATLRAALAYTAGTASVYRVTATWTDTHLGASVSRYKDITYNVPAP